MTQASPDGARARLVEARARVRRAAARKVRTWAFGAEMNFPGDPARPVLMDDTVTADFRVVRYGLDPDSEIRIGPYSGINHTVVMLPGGLHRADWVGVVHVHRAASGEWVFPDGALHSKGPIVIGSDVLIGYEAMVLSGVTIGHGAVVAGRTVVTKDVQPYEIVAGNPQRHVKFRFDEDTRAALLRIAWWDWPAEKVHRLRSEIDSPDVAGFVARHDPLRDAAR